MKTNGLRVLLPAFAAVLAATSGAAGAAGREAANEAILWCNPANTGAEDGLTKETGFATLWKAFAGMSPGSEVIIADGNWTSHAGMTIEHPHLPPSGSAESYTRIRAETDWQARLPHIFSSGTGRSCVEVRGVVFDSRKTPHSHVVTNWHHTKFIRCGFLAGKLQGNSHTCGFGSGPVTEGYGQYNHHNLMEECIAWGGGRYVFYSKYAKYNVFRRCVARRDYNAAPQIFNFRAYACDDNVFQNCISIDSDRVEHYAPLNHESGGYWIGDQYGTTGNEIHGCISIKDVRLPFYVAGSKGGGTSIVKNCAALDVTVSSGSTLSAFILTNNGGLEASKILGAGGMVEGYDGFYRKNAGVFTITDSILKDVADYGVAGVECSYINHFNAGKGNFGEGSASTDPEENGLLYPVRIEEGSPLAAAGAGGGVAGPTILKKIGVSGTLYGEPGWDALTDDDLWPFPNEEKIKTLMSETVEGVPGVYGFTAYESPFGSPNTLTSYIWEYLGNPIPPEVYAKTWHMPDDAPDLHAAFAKMSGGDTLVIRAGTYTGASNVISNDHKPPDGTAEAYTVVQAADGADVFFDGEFARSMFRPTAMHYVQLEGIKWGQYSDGGAVELHHSSYVKMLGCAAFDMGSSCSGDISVSKSSYVLLEDCWVWGNARYSFLVYQSDHVVVRRCVARMDRSTGVKEPIGIFRNYTSDYVEWQNCIAIDSDRRAEYFTEPKDALYGAFYHSGSSNIYWRGVIALNNQMPAGWVGGGSHDKEFHNCVFWDNWSGVCTQGTTMLDHCTVNSNSTATDEDGIMMGGGVGLWWDQTYDNSVTNSIIYACPWWGLRQSGPGSFLSNCNIVYGNKTNHIDVTPGAKDISGTVDPISGKPGNGKPALKYILRIEKGSDASGAADDGGDIGANILKCYGVSGTLWGEPGYNTLTDEELWPFPNEEKIRRDMRAYSYDDGKLSGKRGFCADGQTLTGYIWERLGNEIPPEIYRRRTSP